MFLLSGNRRYFLSQRPGRPWNSLAGAVTLISAPESLVLGSCLVPKWLGIEPLVRPCKAACDPLKVSQSLLRANMSDLEECQAGASQGGFPPVFPRSRRQPAFQVILERAPKEPG